MICSTKNNTFLILYDLIFKINQEGYKSDFEKTKDSLIRKQTQKDLLKENENIGDLKKYLMQVNNFQINFKPDFKNK